MLRMRVALVGSVAACVAAVVTTSKGVLAEPAPSPPTAEPAPADAAPAEAAPTPEASPPEPLPKEPGDGTPAEPAPPPAGRKADARRRGASTKTAPARPAGPSEDEAVVEDTVPAHDTLGGHFIVGVGAGVLFPWGSIASGASQGDVRRSRFRPRRGSWLRRPAERSSVRRLRRRFGLPSSQRHGLERQCQHVRHRPHGPLPPGPGASFRSVAERRRRVPEHEGRRIHVHRTRVDARIQLGGDWYRHIELRLLGPVARARPRHVPRLERRGPSAPNPSI